MAAPLGAGAGAVIGSLISAGGALFGGKKDREAAEDQALFNYLAQKEFAQHGTRWKVEDARAAGLHPLFALGGPGASFSPGPITLTGSSWAQAGQDLGRAAQAAMTRPETAVIDQQLRNARAQEAKDLAAAALYDSERARNAQAGIVEFPGPGPYSHFESMGQVEVGPLTQGSVVPGQVQGKPHEIISPAETGGNVLAGAAEARYRLGQIAPGVSLLFPHQGGQFQEDLSILDAPTWVAANVSRFGWNGFLGRWLAARDKLVNVHRWDAPLVDAIEKVIRLHRSRGR